MSDPFETKSRDRRMPDSDHAAWLSEPPGQYVGAMNHQDPWSSLDNLSHVGGATSATYSNSFGSPGPITMESLLATMRALPPPVPTVADITAAPDLVAKLRRELPAVLALPVGGSICLHEDPRLPAGMWHEGAPFAHVVVQPDGSVLGIWPHVVVMGPPRPWGGER